MLSFPGDSDGLPGFENHWLQSRHTCEREDTCVDLGFLCHRRVVTGVLLLLLLLLLDAAYSHHCSVIQSCFMDLWTAACQTSLLPSPGVWLKLMSTESMMPLNCLIWYVYSHTRPNSQCITYVNSFNAENKSVR